MPRSDTTEQIGPGGFDEVLAAAQAGADWAVAVLYRSLQPQVLRFLRARAGQDAEDIASQVWLEVARALPAFVGGEHELRAFVFTVAHRRLANHLRAARRRPIDLVADARLDDLADGPGPDDHVLARLAGDEAARRVTELLPRDQAEVVLLRVLAGLGTDEVAHLLGKRPGTVRVLQHRALRRLARELGDNR